MSPGLMLHDSIDSPSSGTISHARIRDPCRTWDPIHRSVVTVSLTLKDLEEFLLHVRMKASILSSTEDKLLR